MTFVTTLRAAAVVAALAAILPGQVFAADTAPVRVGEACKAEISVLCAGVAGEGGGINRCLRDNEAKLGPECGSAVKAAQARREQLKAACASDADKFCKDEAGKGGKLVQCLKGKTAELSKSCADTLAAMTAAGAGQGAAAPAGK